MPALDPATIVTVPRTMTNYVVTEYGAVDLKARTTWERAERLISIDGAEGATLAHPVVLLHNQPAGNPATVSALPVIIQFFRTHGNTFVALYAIVVSCRSTCC